MPISIPAPVKDLVHFGQRAFMELSLKETTALSAEDIKQFQQDYPLKPNTGHLKFHRNDPNYPDIALRILDYFMFQGLNDILATVSNANILEGYEKIQKHVFKKMEANGVNSMARYLGKNRVPEFADHEKLYKKMQWLEWMLTHAMELWEQSVIPDYTVSKVGGPQTQFYFRLTAVTAFLNTYVSKHPEKTEELKHFRATYAMDNISHSHAAALKIVAPALVLEEEKVEEFHSPEVVALREDINNLNAEEENIRERHELILMKGKKLQKEFLDLKSNLISSVNKIDYLQKNFLYFGRFGDPNIRERVQNLQKFIDREIKGNISEWLQFPHDPVFLQPQGKLAKLSADIRENTKQKETNQELLDRIKIRKKKLIKKLKKIEIRLAKSKPRQLRFQEPPASQNNRPHLISQQSIYRLHLPPIETEQDRKLPLKKGLAIAAMLIGGLTVGVSLTALGSILLLEIAVSPLAIPATLFCLAGGSAIFYYGTTQMHLFESPNKPKKIEPSSNFAAPSVDTSSNPPSPRLSLHRQPSTTSLNNSSTLFKESNSANSNSSSLSLTASLTRPRSQANPGTRRR